MIHFYDRAIRGVEKQIGHVSYNIRLKWDNKFNENREFLWLKLDRNWLSLRFSLW